MASNRITKREVIGMLLKEEGIKGNQIYLDYLNNELALLDKKSASKKLTKTQEANVDIKTTILEVLSTLGKGTVSEIQSKDERLSGLSKQKVSALLRQLIDEGSVVKGTDKKKSVFSLATTEGE